MEMCDGNKEEGPPKVVCGGSYICQQKKKKKIETEICAVITNRVVAN